MDFINWLDQQVLLEDRTKRDERKKIQAHHPSSASAVINGKVVGRCLRQSFYKWHNFFESDPIDAGGIWKQSIGDMIHEKIQGIFLSGSFEGIEKEAAVEVKYPDMTYPIMGRTDLMSRKLGWGLEIKTTYGAGMTSPDGIKNSGAKMEHRLQVAAYMKMTGIKKWFYIYFARDNAYRLSLVEEYSDATESLWASMIARWKALEGHLSANTIPPRDYKVIINEKGEIQDTMQRDGKRIKSEWPCLYCAWKTYCWKDAKPEDGLKF